MRRNSISNVWLTTAAAVAGALAVPAVGHAEQVLKTRVPFSFVAGDVRLPAGTYVVGLEKQQSLVSIASTDGRHFAFVLMSPMAADRAGRDARLVFDAVGGEHVLSQVVGNGREGREIVGAPGVRTSVERVVVAPER